MQRTVTWCVGLLLLTGLAGPASAKVAIGTNPEQPKTTSEVRFKPGDVFQDCDDCPEMVVVPAGSFMMGSPASEEGRSDHEGPQHRVTFARAFAAGRFEVTVDQFAAFVRETRRKMGNRCWTYEGGWKERLGRSFRRPGFSQTGSQPVVCVTWDDAKAYVSWLSGKTGKVYRLPSESEWEYAARAGTTTPFSTGRRITTDQANFNGTYIRNGSRKGRNLQKTIAVGSFPANAFGLHDMQGNVWEYVEDCYGDSYRTTPSDGSPAPSDSCSFRVRRGGSWNNGPGGLRSADRSWSEPPGEYSNVGFRVARTLTDAELGKQ